MSLVPERRRTTGSPAGATLRVLVPGASLLFLASAAASVWAAYDRTPALISLAAIAGGLLLAAVVVAWAGRDGAGVAVLGFVALIAAAALSELRLLGLEQTSGPYEGSVAVLIPLGMATVAWCLGAEYRLAGLGCLGLVLLCTALLALGSERAPLYALVAGSLLALIAMALIRPNGGWVRRLLLLMVVVALLGAVVVYLGLVYQPEMAPALLDEIAPGLIDRLWAWNEALPLVTDYAFTGSGLANTGMVHASYLLLSHVPYLQHVHNLPLQIAIEQGVFGLMAFLALLGSAVAAAGLVLQSFEAPHRRMAAAVLASLFTLLLLGLIDGELSLAPFQLAIFTPLAAAWSLHRSVAGDLDNLPRRRWVGSLAGAAALAALVAAPALLLGQASLLTNLSAVRQQQVELTVYDQQTWSFQDRVRRERADALAPVMTGYEQALAVDSSFAPANRRLGQILLSLGRPDQALPYLRMAAASEPSLPTLLLLGEAEAVTGNPEEAAALWKGLHIEQDQLWLRWAWHDSIGDAQGARWIEEAARAAAQSAVGGV